MRKTISAVKTIEQKKLIAPTTALSFSPGVWKSLGRPADCHGDRESHERTHQNCGVYSQRDQVRKDAKQDEDLACLQKKRAAGSVDSDGFFPKLIMKSHAAF